MPRQACAILLLVSTAHAAPLEIGPTLDPAGAITVITLFGADADPESTGWTQVQDSRAIRTQGSGRPLTYHIVIPDDSPSWRLGITARSISSASPSTRFQLTVNDQPFTPLDASPAADSFTTHWTPLGEFSGLIALTITPESDNPDWQGIDIGAIQLARRNGTETRAEGGADTTITRNTAPLTTGKSSGGGGGGGGGTPPQSPFPEFTPDPPIDPEPEEPLEEFVETPPPPPIPPSPPEDPPTRGTDDDPGGIPAPPALVLALSALLPRKRRSS